MARKHANNHEGDADQGPGYWNLARVVLLVVVSTIFFSLGIGLQLMRFFRSELPSIAKMELDPPNMVTRIFSSDSVQLAELYTERRVPVSLELIPRDLKAALLSVEDRKFYSHWGIDFWGVVRAMIHNQVRGKIVQGGSTITQQLARVLFLTREKTYIRKIREAILALEIERTYTKDEILERYFNQIYFGSGAWGIQEAARTYFGKDVGELDLAECALLAGLPNAPSRNNPLADMANAIDRRNWVITCMDETGYLSGPQADSLRQVPVRLAPKVNRGWIAPYFVDHVRQQLIRDYSEDELYRLGLQVYTTLDLRLQRAAETAMEQHLQTIEAGKLRYFPHKTRAQIVGADSLEAPERSHTTYLQGMLLALDPVDGGIKAMIGGRNYWESKFNRAVQALRQPGSSFKPFVYTAAIDNGIPACQVFEDSPISLPQADGTMWQPQNYEGDFNGPVTMRYGLTKSLNLVAIKTLMTVGTETVAAYARKMGITTNIPPYESIAIGSADVYPIELVAAYTAFANMGVRCEPMAISQIRDNEGNLLRSFAPRREEVLSPQTACIVVSMLQDVTRFGTGAGMRGMGFTRPSAGKTGTTNDYTDAWFVGFTPDLVCGVWIGFDQPQRITNAGTGSLLALPVWTEFMKVAHEGIEEHEFEFPSEGLTTRRVCKSSGLLATDFCPAGTVYTEIFKVGTEPADNQECYVHKPSIYSH